ALRDGEPGPRAPGSDNSTRGSTNPPPGGSRTDRSPHQPEDQPRQGWANEAPGGVFGTRGAGAPPPTPTARGRGAPPRAPAHIPATYSRNRRAQRSRFASPPPPRSGEHISYATYPSNPVSRSARKKPG